MSELSTVAIKDGHRGHLPHHHHNQPMDAERADRISRLAGLDRVDQPRASLTPSQGGVQPSPRILHRATSTRTISLRSYVSVAPLARHQRRAVWVVVLRGLVGVMCMTPIR